MIVHTDNPSTRETEVGRSEFKTSLGFIGKLYLKDTKLKNKID
jgi:hypothetical protein